MVAAVGSVRVVIEPRSDVRLVETEPTTDAGDGDAVFGDEAADVALGDVEGVGELADGEPAVRLGRECGGHGGLLDDVWLCRTDIGVPGAAR
jgi:hypothetical protein